MGWAAFAAEHEPDDAKFAVMVGNVHDPFRLQIGTERRSANSLPQELALPRHFAPDSRDKVQAAGHAKAAQRDVENSIAAPDVNRSRFPHWRAMRRLLLNLVTRSCREAETCDSSQQKQDGQQLIHPDSLVPGSRS